MTTTEIKQQLCIYDKRNPNHSNKEQRLNKDNLCTCDNCYDGKHNLANELLRVKELLNSAVEPIR